MQVKLPLVFRCPWHFTAFGFGLGAMPFAPGTFGTLIGVLMVLLLGQLPLWLYAFLTLLATGFGIWLCGKVADELQVHDHPGIVWDEVVGYMLTMFAMPKVFSVMVVAFILFRLFDILKPYPIKRIDETVSGGLGIMLDDVLAALPAWLILYLAVHVFGLGS